MTGTESLKTIRDFAKEIGWSRQALGELVRTLGIETHPMPGMLTAKGLDAEAQARIRRVLCLSDRATA